MNDIRPIAIGDRIHGYCGGYLGRDHYDCATVEAVGPDWVVVRSPRGAVGIAKGYGILRSLAEYRRHDTCTFYSEPEACTFYEGN